jgi:hypothetical protein
MPADDELGVPCSWESVSPWDPEGPSLGRMGCPCGLGGLVAETGTGV